MNYRDWWLGDGRLLGRNPLIAALRSRCTVPAAYDQLTNFSGRSVNDRSCWNLPPASRRAAGQQRAQFRSFECPAGNPESAHRFCELEQRGLVGLQPRLRSRDGINPAPYAIALRLREDDDSIREQRGQPDRCELQRLPANEGDEQQNSDGRYKQ